MQSMVQVTLLTPIAGVGAEGEEVSVNAFMAQAWELTGAVEILGQENPATDDGAETAAAANAGVETRDEALAPPSDVPAEPAEEPEGKRARRRARRNDNDKEESNA